MKRTPRRALALVTSAALGLSILLAGAAPAHADTPFLTKTQVWANGEGGTVAFVGFGTAVTNAGTLIVFTEARYDASDSGERASVYKRSTNNGATWSAQGTIEAPGPDGDSWGNATPVVDKNTGRIWIFYNLTYGAIPGDESPDYAKVYYKYSDNDGVSWSARTEVTNLWAADSATYDWTLHGPNQGHGIQISNGRLIVPIGHRTITNGVPVNERNYGVSFIYRDPSDTTWKAGGVIPLDPDLSINEGRVAQLADGSLLINARQAAAGTLRAYSRSTDGGITWTAPVDANNIAPYFATDSSFTRWTLATSSTANRMLFTHPVSLTNRSKLYAQISYDEGQSFAYGRMIETAGATYSDVAILPDNTAVVAYGTENNDNDFFAESVTLARFNVEWITEGKDTLAAGPTGLAGWHEFEGLPLVASSDPRQESFVDTAASAGLVDRVAVGSINDYFTVRVSVPAAGTYTLNVRPRVANSRAIVKLTATGLGVTGTAQNKTFDLYSATAGYSNVNLGNLTFTGAGTVDLKFTVTGKNAASSGYTANIDRLTLTQ